MQRLAKHFGIAGPSAGKLWQFEAACRRILGWLLNCLPFYVRMIYYSKVGTETSRDVTAKFSPQANKPGADWSMGPVSEAVHQGFVIGTFGSPSQRIGTIFGRMLSLKEQRGCLAGGRDFSAKAFFGSGAVPL